MVTGRAGLGLALLAAASACFPPGLDDTGRRCDSTRFCDDGYICFGGLCGRPDGIDAGPDNWLTNPSFEDLNDAGDPIGWHWQPTGTGRIVLSDSSTSHSGLRSVRIFTKDGGDTPRVVTTPAPVTEPVPDQVWCASAWVRSNQDAGLSAMLLLRENVLDGGVGFQNMPTRLKAHIEWLQLREEYNSNGGDNMDVRVSFGAAANRGELLWADEVTLKRLVTGHCTWP